MTLSYRVLNNLSKHVTLKYIGLKLNFKIKNSIGETLRTVSYIIFLYKVGEGGLSVNVLLLLTNE